MGFDMHWRESPPEVQAAHDAAFPPEGRIDMGNVAVWSEVRDRVGSYFRLNIWAMGRYMEYMAERGMLTDPPHAAYPPYQDFGVSQAEHDRWPEGDAPVTPEYKRWREACQHWTDDDSGGVIPAYKFSSNDGWLLTPREIARSLEALHRWEEQQRDREGQSWIDPLRSEDDGYWDRWIRFLYCARSHGGVEVH